MELAETAARADGSYHEGRSLCMPIPIAIAPFGAFGALARYGLDGLVLKRTAGTFPWRTFAVNVTG
jgi:hypothetical protein